MFNFDRMLEESGWPAFRGRWLTEATAGRRISTSSSKTTD
jgi:hypothetical protein